MKVLKGCILLVFIILLANFATASFLDINLTKDKVGPGQSFDGYVIFNFTEPILKDSKLSFHVNSEVYETQIIDLLEDYDLLEAEYRKNGENLNIVNVDFSKQEKKTVLGLDFSGRDRTAGKISVNSIQFDIKGETFNENKPSDVSIDIGNDNINDYKYQGNTLLGYEQLNRSYLADNTPDGSVYIRGSDIFCESVILNASKKYRLKANVQRLVNDATLNLTLTKEPLGYKPDCSTEKCCEIKTFTGMQQEVNCEIDKDVAEDGIYSLCAYATGDEYATNYFKLGTDLDEKIMSGYANGQDLSEDYYIYGDYAKYNNVLDNSIRVTIDKDVINNYLQNNECDTCLLVPISISSKTPGRVILSNPSIQYEYDGIARELNSFATLSYLAERINNTGTIQRQLTDIKNLIAPNTKGNTNEIYAEINTLNGILKSKRINFKVVDVPKAFIRYGPTNPKTGEMVLFDGSSSTKIRADIIKYEWEFGDGTKAEGEKTSHVYTNESSYNVVLTVTDDDELSGREVLTLTINKGNYSISSEADSIIQDINKLRAKIESGSSQLKDSAEQIGLNEILNNAYTEVTAIKSSNNTNLTEEQKTSKLNEIKNTIPMDISIDITTFTPKITSINDIPTDIAENDNARSQILRAQSELIINGEARSIKLIYSKERIDDFLYIKKTITGNGQKYEVIPTSTKIKDVITPENYNFTTPNIITFSGNTIEYTLEDGLLFNALNTKTINIPSDLENIEDVKTGNKDSVCGDNICDVSQENSDNCAQDCKPQRAYWVMILVIILIGVIVYFGLFFKGGLLNKYLINKPAILMFNNEKDYLAVKNFVRESRKRGIKDDKILSSLKAKKWKDEQIKAVIKEVKTEEKRLKSVVKK
ncbi:MAG: PKD domain-containing protein [Nanoarchaeota archaeon]